MRNIKYMNISGILKQEITLGKDENRDGKFELKFYLKKSEYEASDQKCVNHD